MSTKTVSTQHVSRWLGQWYNALICHQFAEADQWKEKVDNQIMNMEEDQTILIYYSLLTLRHNLLTEQENPNQYLESITPFEEKMGPLLTHYYHLFTGMYEALEGNYTEALQHYSSAEGYLDQIPDDIEKGEYHYRVATVFYHIRQTSLALKHVTEAKTVFDTDPSYLQRSVHCEILLGLCCLTNKDYSLAEDHLNSALAVAVESSSKTLETQIRYNIGFLYSEKGESLRAIQFLEEVDEAGFNPAKTSFLLAREYFNTDQHDLALERISRGLKSCEATGNTEYHHHFSILKAFHDGSKTEDIIAVVREGVSYFKTHQLYGYADDYLTRLADYLCKQKDYRNTSLFF
ncbi:MAG TPA: hypothetical protein VFK33_01725 [Bacillales bacterium]|nr:hypothetical protein [Bacillales bacterium]